MNGRANPPCRRQIGPESCVSHCEMWVEALTGVLVGQVLSHVTKTVRDADAFCAAEGSTVGCAIASASLVPRGLRPWHATKPFVREPGGLMAGRLRKGGPRREGWKAEADDARR